MEARAFGARLRTYLVFAGPATLVFLAVIVAPLIYGAYLTLTDWDGISSAKAFVGAANYLAVLRDAPFWHSMAQTLLFVALSVVLINAAGFLLALMLSAGVRGQNLMRAGFFTPNLIGGIVLGFIWRFVFDQILVAAGKALGLGLFSLSWLSQPGTAFWALVVVTVWQYSGYMMIIYLADGGHSRGPQGGRGDRRRSGFSECADHPAR